MKQIKDTNIKVEFSIRKRKPTDREPTTEDFKKHFKTEDIPKAQEVFTIYDPIEEKFYS
ncbi:hypothetical protein [Staphylococcus pasteuri]|uniref:hypothetical protein n=1 Tax=Staphylococcus pasteuri TaxID=45972 RepID=UPI0015E77747|nr:hypothetical protein [Staphylococcus pasteuri]